MTRRDLYSLALLAASGIVNGVGAYLMWPGIAAAVNCFFAGVMAAMIVDYCYLFLPMRQQTQAQFAELAAMQPQANALAMARLTQGVVNSLLAKLKRDGLLDPSVEVQISGEPMPPDSSLH